MQRKIMNSLKNVKNPSSIATCIISPQYRRRARHCFTTAYRPCRRLPKPLPADPYSTVRARLMAAYTSLPTSSGWSCSSKHPPLSGEQKPSELLAETIRLCPRGQNNNDLFNYVCIWQTPQMLCWFPRLSQRVIRAFDAAQHCQGVHRRPREIVSFLVFVFPHVVSKVQTPKQNVVILKNSPRILHCLKAELGFWCFQKTIDNSRFVSQKAVRLFRNNHTVGIQLSHYVFLYSLIVIGLLIIFLQSFLSQKEPTPALPPPPLPFPSICRLFCSLVPFPVQLFLIWNFLCYLSVTVSHQISFQTVFPWCLVTISNDLAFL